MSSTPKLASHTKLAFGIGQIAEGIQVAAFLFFLLFYYNQVLGVPGTLCGIALALSLLFDAVTDPLIGNLSDAWRGKMGRRHPFMYLAAAPLGLCFFLLFNPQVEGDMPLFFWLLGMTVMCRGAMTLYHVPHSALGAELSQDYSERTVLVAMRHFFGAIAFILVCGLGFLVYFVGTPEYPNGQMNPAAYQPFSAWLGGLMALTVWYSAIGTHSRIPQLPQAREQQRFSWGAVIGDTRQAMENMSFRWIMAGFSIIIIAFGAAGSVNLYMLTFFWSMSGGQIFVILIAGPVGSMFGYASSRWFFLRYTKKQAVSIGIAIWLVAHAISVPLFIAGLLPERGSTGLMWAVAGFGFVASYGIAQLLVGLGTMLADIADEHELRSHRRQEGIFFGAFSFANKSSAALGSLIGGTVLDLIHWPTGENIRTAADVPWETVVELGLIWGPISALLAIPGIWCVSRYQLTKERHATILSTLAERNEETPSATDVA
ncbi:MAG: MFS transporter [Pseudomonadales bacterium]